MACWNRVTAHVVEDLPRDQVEGLCYARKVPLIYARAALNNWRAFADARISSVSPRGNSLFWDSTSIAAGAEFGTAYGPTPAEPPEVPAMLNFTVVPSYPEATLSWPLTSAASDTAGAELPRAGGRDLGRARPYGQPFRRGLRSQRDVDSVMLNRWNYGYAHELTSVWDPSLYGPVADHRRWRVAGRTATSHRQQRSGAFAYTHSAINEGYRAVQDPRKRRTGRAAAVRTAHPCSRTPTGPSRTRRRRLVGPCSGPTAITSPGRQDVM